MRQSKTTPMAVAFQSINIRTKRFCAALSATALMATASASSAEMSSVTVDLDIPSQNLNDALQSLAMVLHRKMLYSSELVAGKSSEALQGQFTAEQAFSALLDGTELTYELTSDGYVLIRKIGKNAVSTSLRNSPDTLNAALLRMAQTEGGEQGTGESQVSDAGSTRGKDFEAKLEEIVVTAQKREQNLKDVPISISVLSGKDLDRSTLTGVSEILSRVPGMSVTQDGDTNGLQLSLRGVTAAGGKFSGASPIAYYVDSIPFGLVRTALVPDMGAYDLDRIEVLRGPQGTLYGAGGSGGVVRVLTHDANLNDYEFKTRAGFSSVEDGGLGYRVDAAANVPIIEGKLAVRAVVGYQDIPGWIDSAPYPPNAPDPSSAPVIKKDVNDGDQRNLRLKVMAQPTERLSIGLSTWNTRTRYDAPQLGDDNNRTVSSRPEPNSSDLDAYALKVDYEFPALSFSSMSSYVDYVSAAKSAAFADFFNLPGTFDTALWSKVYSQEIILNSRLESPWRWSAGIFYRNAEDRTDQYGYFNQRADYFADYSEQSAVFAEVGRRFWDDKLEWAIGLRYFHDKAATQSLDNTIPDQANVPLSRIGDSFDATTPRAVLTWHPSENLTVYGTYGQGFRSGAQQTPLALNTAPEFAPAKPDKLHSYEIGAKGDLLGGRLSFETALYYIDWQDTQQVLYVELAGAGGIFVNVLTNASSVSGFGMDVALTARPLSGLEIGASFGTNDLTFDENVFSNNNLLFSKGDRLGASPKFTLNPFVAYSFPFGSSGYTGRFSADASYVSPAITKKLGDPNGVDGDPVKIARAGFSIEAPEHWSVSLTIDNLTNYADTPAVLPSVYQFFTYRVRPRTMNLQFDFHF